MYKVFIDGSAGTTGLRIAERLSGRPGVALLSIPDAERKDVSARLGRIAEADVTILCLPDDGAREIVRAVGAAGVDARIIDCSTAHRTDRAWLYGLPEAVPHKETRRIANPGCHATGFILAVRPLVEAGLIEPGALLCAHSVTGYSGGGKAMIAQYEGVRGSDALLLEAPRQYGLSQQHKHLPEMLVYAGLSQPPVFSPIVADFYAGMLVSVALPGAEPGRGAKVTPKAVQRALAEYYAGCPLVHVRALGYDPEGGFLSANAFERRDDAELLVLGQGAVGPDGQARVTVVCRFDNLGKGASGAAIQNMNLMLGLPETEGLVVAG
ncbi:MAG: N-acetyl-gamma-glutamyl-phosphate reductase [Clostridiales Family XIII bacterium]|jgi:N-acetyl-gamma-glutamyl-phosphate reductase|nr:N-acetyl-gamma-glutamyl-phosphate reductase [Clostridiales Family XIII bacterium]